MVLNVQWSLVLNSQLEYEDIYIITTYEDVFKLSGCSNLLKLLHMDWVGNNVFICGLFLGIFFGNVLKGFRMSCPKS
jgi:hypothetical protein